MPYDAVNEDIREQVIKRFQELENKGAILYFCRWNIGDPERTSTAAGRWYSFHGKFIVTDKSAISLSANLTEQSELDAILIYRDEPEKIREFNQKFDELLDLFHKSYSGYSGKIRSLILGTEYPNAESLLRVPKTIETDTHKDHWVLDYPSSLCPDDIALDDRLYLCPFDVRGRIIIQKLIQSAEKYLYISTESFTDPDIYNDIIKARLSGLDVKILTGSTSMDFSDRLQRMLRSLLASGIKVNTTVNPLHAKLLITDHMLAVSSINLNKINLGFSRSTHLWRENTETITLSSNIEIVQLAKLQFENNFDQSINILAKLAERIEGDVTALFRRYFGLRSEREVKGLFSRFILSEEIAGKQVTLKIGRIVRELTTGRNIVRKKDLVMALILHLLSDNKLKYNQIEQKLSSLNAQIDLDKLLRDMIELGYIEQEEDYFKLKVVSLF